MAPVEEDEDMAPVGRALEAPFGAAPLAFDDWRKLLDEVKPDIAVVNPPFHRIGDVARVCLERGIHVLAEKPLATGWADYLALRALDTKQAKLMAMFTMRYDGLLRAAQKAVAEGVIGTPVLYSAQKSYPLQGWDGKPRPAFHRQRSTYGGSIPWVGIHPIDLFLWFSESAFTEVYASQTAVGNLGHGELESAAVLHFKLANGSLATAHLDFLRRPTNPWSDDRFRVAGDKGILEIADGKATIETGEGRRELEPEPALSLFADFLDWVEKDKPMLLGTADCLRATEAALRARDAADWGRVQAF